MKLHKKYNHSLLGVSYWGKRSEVALRINFGEFQSGETFPKESPHYHKTRTTYFCVLSGSMIIEIEGEEMVITPEAMLEIPPMSTYRVNGVGEDGCCWIVIGDHNREDRVDVG